MLCFEWIIINTTPDSHFPHGVPSPLLTENQVPTCNALSANDCDLALARGGDSDRCFFFDANDRFIEGYYAAALLAQMLLKNSARSKIIHDLRLTWNTIEVAQEVSGEYISPKVGNGT